MVDDDTRVLTLDDAPTQLLVPIVPGEPLLPWVDPRRYGPNGPVWDATDELYITYDEQGNRVLTTTGEKDIFAAEHSYQRTGSARYDELSDLGSGERAGGRGGRSRPGWANPTAREHPAVHADRDRNRTGEGLASGTRDHHPSGRDGAHGAPRHARHSVERRRIPQRPDSRAEQRIRSHRHCPGCAGHSNNDRSAWVLLLRALGAWSLGWVAIWTTGLGGLSLAQYFVLTVLGFAAAALVRPVWRELANSQDRQALGGRR